VVVVSLLRKKFVLLLSAAAIAVTGIVGWQTHTESAGTKVLRVKLLGNGLGNNGNGLGNGAGIPAKDFTISGQLTGLAPGVTAHLYLTVTNPNNQAIKVTALSAVLSSVVKASNAPSGTCAASTSNLQIGAWTGEQFTIAKNASGSSSPSYIPVTMPASVANACQGATFNLTYSSTAVQG
jgi:hypothetical protein